MTQKYMNKASYYKERNVYFLDALQKQKCQIDEQISDLRAGRNGTQTTIVSKS